MEKFYIKMLENIRQRPFLEKILIFITKYFPYLPFGLYPCLLIYLFVEKSPLLVSTIWKPLCAFVFVSIIRKIINRPRPYETMNIQPIVGHKKGESFPSRHTLSSMIIALVCFPVSYPLGIFSLFIAIMISVSRILVGVHYLSDVFVSVIIAFSFYFISFSSFC